MATITSPTRLPFGEITASRLQNLSATKNCQNALTDMIFTSGKESKPTTSFSPKPTSKRSYAATILEDEAFDAENINPNVSPPKRSKGLDGAPASKSQFILYTDNKGMNDEDAENTSPLTPTTPTHFPTSTSHRDLDIQLPTVSSAPAGRSPKHKRIGILNKKRTSLSPYRRVDPPSFGSLRSSINSTLKSSKSSSDNSLPFSIDAALSGTLAKSKPVIAPTREKSMPKGWFFDIYEDTADEEASNLMEHSTCILDISSDDEAGSSRLKDDRGKENVPPPDHCPQGPNGEDVVVSAVAETKPRRSVDVDAMTEADRAPLGTLPTEDFYAKGLDANSIEVVSGENGEVSATVAESKIVDVEEKVSDSGSTIATGATDLNIAADQSLSTSLNNT